MRLLALDTASALCSAALLIDGELRERETATTRDHAQLLLPMIQSLLQEAGAALTSLDAIAFGRGPGSFTGLRVAASVTQGLAFGADLPVLAVSDLAALALQAMALPGEPPVRLLACMDARMHQVYWGIYEPVGERLQLRGAEKVGDPLDILSAGPDATMARRWRAAGAGLGRYAEVLAPLGLAPSAQLTLAEPRAREIAQLGASAWAAGEALPADLAVPVYLRDDVARAQGGVIVVQ